jgi:exopolyphosphatase/guanosine-5'-triphosphate,3'-diphosphate pyrophosphatase
MSADARIQQAEALLEEFGWEVDHCRQVRDLALMLFDQLQSLHHLGPAERTILNAAALLHDIGWTVGGAKHHKHSAVLIRDYKNSLSAFEGGEIELIANVARYHRKSPPSLDHEPFAELPRKERDKVERLAALLRIADGLDRPHRQTVRKIRCEITDRQVVVRVEADGNSDRCIEGAARKRDLFEAVYKVPLVFPPK